MNRERSCFEHKGMPLRATENVGRVPLPHAPWLQSFDRMPAVNAEERKLFPGSRELFSDASQPEDTPATGDVLSKTKSEDGGQSVEGQPNVVLRRSVAGKATSTQAPANPPNIGGRNPGKPETAKGNTQLSPMGGSSDAAAGGPNPLWSKRDISSLEVLSGTKQETPGTGKNVASSFTSGNDAEQPHVTIQKHVTIQTALSPTGSAITSTTMPGTDGTTTAVNHTQIVASPMAFAGDGATGFRTDSMLQNPSARMVGAAPEASSQERQKGTQIVPVRMEMSGSKLMQERVTVVMPAAPKARNNRGQQQLLERLNQSAPQPQHGGRRVQIRNLHITVQKPATPQVQPASQPAQPQPAAAAQKTFFNPWERHLSAFD